MTCDDIRNEILKVEPLARLEERADADGDRWLEWVLQTKRLGFTYSQGFVTWYFVTKRDCCNGTLIDLQDLADKIRWMR